MLCAGGLVGEGFSALSKEIGMGLVRLGTLWRQAGRSSAVDVIEDLADEFRIGNVGNDAKLAPTVWAAGDVPQGTFS